jgi:hypothetical protein
MFFCFLLILLHRVSGSPLPVPKRSRSMTPPSLRMQAGKAPRSRTVIRQPSRQSWTPRTLHPAEAGPFCRRSAPRGGQKLARVIALLERREITHAHMFMKALDQMGKLDDPFFGNIPPDETVKLVFNLSQDEDERGPLGMEAMA